MEHCIHACSVTSVVSHSLHPYGLQPARLFCPQDSPGKNTGGGYHFLLQGMFLIQRLNPHTSFQQRVFRYVFLFGDPKIRVCVCVRKCTCAQSHPTLCNPMDCSPPGSCVHGISQAKTLEWVAISFSRGSFHPRDQTHVSCISCIGKCIL